MIIENLLPKTYQDEIETAINNHGFPWYFQENQIYTTRDDIPQIFGMTHMFYKDGKKNSSYFDSILPLTYFFEDRTKLKIKSIFRMQANISFDQVTTEDIINNSIHIDLNHDSFYSLVYYVVDSDGDTIIYDNKKNIIESCSPKKGNAIYFKSNQPHFGSLPKEHKSRIVINCIFEVEKND